MKKVHLGCWHRQIPGFIHVDLCDMPHIDHKSGIDSLPFFADASIDLIYCGNAFQYFDREEVVSVLAEWLRVLKPGALLRLSVPNFSALIEVYEKTGELSRMLGPLYGRMEITTVEGPLTIYHKTVYDEDSLSSVLRDSGFESIERWDWRTTEHANIDDYSQAYFPHMQKDTGLLVALNLQARKI